MGKQCCVKGCNSEKYPGSKYSLFRLPRDEAKQKEWRKVLNEKVKNPIKPTSSICSKHFKSSDLTRHLESTTLRREAVPCIFAVEQQNYATRVFAIETTDEETPDVKEEPVEETEYAVDDIEHDTHNTEKVFVTSIAYKDIQSEDDSKDLQSEDDSREIQSEDDTKETQSEDDSKEAQSEDGSKEAQNEIGQSRRKRARVNIPEEPVDEDDLYEFGKYVAEQLLCLDVKDARVARLKIVVVLSKFKTKRIRTCPSTSKRREKSNFASEVRIGNPVVPPVKSMPQVVIARPKFLILDSGSPVSHVNPLIPGTPVSQVNPLIPESSVSHVNPLIPGSPVSHVNPLIPVSSVSKVQNPRLSVNQVNIPGQLANQVHIPTSSVSYTSQVDIRPIKTLPTMVVGPKLNQFAVMNVKMGSSSADPYGGVVVPPTRSGFNRNKEKTSISKPGCGTSVESVVAQSSNVVPTGKLVTQKGSSSMDFSQTSVNTKPESVSTHINLFGCAKRTKPVVVKYESESDDEF